MKEIGIVILLVVTLLAFTSFADRQADKDQEERDKCDRD